MRDPFLRLGEEFPRFPRELSAVVLGLADSFRTLRRPSRGNVERWLGLVFAVMMRHRRDYLNLGNRPDAAGASRRP